MIWNNLQNEKWFRKILQSISITYSVPHTHETVRTLSFKHSYMCWKCLTVDRFITSDALTCLTVPRAFSHFPGGNLSSSRYFWGTVLWRNDHLDIWVIFYSLEETILQIFTFAFGMWADKLTIGISKLGPITLKSKRKLPEGDFLR